MCLEGRSCPHFTPACHSLQPTSVLLGKILLICKDQSEQHFFGSPGSGHTCSCMLSLIHTQAHCSQTRVFGLAHTLAHCSHNSCLPGLSPYKASLCMARPRKWLWWQWLWCWRSCQLRSACLRGISPKLPVHLDWASVGIQCLLGQSVITVCTTDAQEREHRACLTAKLC